MTEHFTQPYRISVIIPAFNHAVYLAGAIDSVLSQTFPVSEVIVVDDGSTDQTCDVAAAYGDRIRYIRQPNRGLSAARNTGIAAATGDWLAFLDADDFWLPVKIEQQVAHLRQFPRAVLVYCSAWMMGSDGTKTLANATDPQSLWPALRYQNCVSGGSAVLVRKDVVVEAGCFDEGLRACEDWDLWVRLAVNYWERFVAVHEPVLVIRAASTTMSADYIRMTHNTEKILEKTLLQGLDGLSRSCWRRRIRSADLYRAAISARYWSDRMERALLGKSLLQWPSPFFIAPRLRALQINLTKFCSQSVRRMWRTPGKSPNSNVGPPALSQ